MNFDKYILSILLLSASNLANAQDLKLSSFVDSYYAYSTKASNTNTEEYLTQPHRDFEPNINLAYIRADAENNNFRARLTLQSGSSVEANYSTESKESLRYIQEAYLGYKFSDRLSLDTGIYLSHIGIETFISKDNWAYTRLLASEFSPYYQSGARLIYDPDGPFSYQLHLLNGWQNISDVGGRTALGTQMAYQLAKRSNLVFNTFLGKESEGLRLFANLNLTLRIAEQIELGLLADLGNQQREDNSNDQWYTAAALIRYHFSSKLRLVTRIEYYSDPENAIVSTLSNKGFETLGASVGLDYKALESLLLRIEYRSFLARDKIYRTNSTASFSDMDSFIVASAGYSF